MRAGTGIKAHKTKMLVLAVASMVVGVGLFLGFAEVALRLLPVASGLRGVAVTPADPVFRLTPNRDFVYSLGWDMAMANRGRINNAGFANDQTYVKDGLPLLAVIGDSYIEALMVPYAQTVHGRLAAALAGKARVYSFAASGAPLSQYAVWARYAVREFGAAALLINVVGNDFDESLMEYRVSQGFWLYAKQPGGTLKLELVEYRPSFARALAQHSALIRYLAYNIRAQEALQSLGGLGAQVSTWFSGKPAPAPVYAGNTLAEASDARVNASLMAIDAFLNDLPTMTGLPAGRIAFALDGFRYPEAAAGGAGTYFDRMRREFAARAAAKGYEVLDLDPPFNERYRRTGERFEFLHDGHWNASGHGVAADAMLKSRLVQSLGR